MIGSTPRDPRTLRFGAPGGDDSGRSRDEIRIIQEMTNQELDAFLMQNPVDIGAANQLKRESPYIILAVMERGPLRGCRDPSGVIAARIRSARSGTLDPNPRPPPQQSLPPPVLVALDPNASEIDMFLAANRIDHSAGMALKNESTPIQEAVMAKGPLGSSTNPSASLMARIRIVKEHGISQPFGLPGGPPPLPVGMQPPMFAIANQPDTTGSAPGAGLENGPGTHPTVSNSLADTLMSIQKINQIGIGMVATAAPPVPSGVAVPSLDDQRLQEEARKAIERMQADL